MLTLTLNKHKYRPNLLCGIIATPFVALAIAITLLFTFVGMAIAALIFFPGFLIGMMGATYIGHE